MELEVTSLFGDISTVSIGEDDSPKLKSSGRPENDKRPFALTDMLFIGDKKKMWVEYRKLINEGYSPDSLFAPIWWGIKSVLFTKKGISGVAPYVSGKISRGLHGVSMSDCYEIALSFLEMVTDARTIPNQSTELMCEKWILSLPFNQK